MQTDCMRERERIDYLDIAKFIGMFCIYLGHFGPEMGKSYGFVFTFHVPLFFFLSGCTETLSREISWRRFAAKKTRRLLLPFFFFALLSLLVYVVYVNDDSVLHAQFLLIVQGCVRNTFLAGGLWFLSCLFVTSMIFDGLRRILRPWAVLPICILLYVAASRLMQPGPVVQPAWPYNLDSALYYIVFFAAGFTVFPVLHRLLSRPEAAWRVLRAVLACGTGAYALMVFFEKDPLNAWRFHPTLSLVYALLQPLAMIYLTLYVSRLLTHVGPFLAMGRDSLYLCGSEFFIKLLIPSALSIVGLEVTLSHPITAYVYAAICMVASHYLLTPVEKGVLKRLGCK